MSSAKRHPAGVANYRGDMSHIVGEVHGPTTYRSILVATGAEYDPATDRTRVSFGHATVDEVRELAALGWRP